MLFFLLSVKYYTSPRSTRQDLSNISMVIPKEYDFLKEYPECDFGPLNQECGCCYAYGPLKAMSHRFCKALGRKVLLSTQYIVACDIADNGCVGGCERSVLYFMEQHGVTDVQCHPWSAQRKYSNNFCERCSNESASHDSFKMYRAVYSSTTHYIGINDIKKAILMDGPLSASIAVDYGFSSYRGGIYKSSLTGKIDAGNHAVELIGWGSENGTDYWIILNQYGEHWGEKGRMRILMGSNEGLIESFLYGAKPLIEDHMLKK
ncbi:Clan CA, family C1, cathepsin B-like cysteine peptidase [Tritrichomonas foetus]|uniref:Clan CA, family C1, cathepsin B-like cysteine peptidase n=1 Tax=Tritrichomonas foetus TaxID=1144522 RepID=A0A1J4JLR4_9EUKA|nr:Clan CA, family C1, cathepsin B-like cysteine peptidase [Tritrichomonas foetus]|eukprot:OHS98212.1 Clan CA, family C1, cathepsin B-like cysteine peptidase [Tritrichomonas foetus]